MTIHLRIRIWGSNTWNNPETHTTSAATAPFDLTSLTGGTTYEVEVSLESAFPPADTVSAIFTTTPATKVSGVNVGSVAAVEATVTVTIVHPEGNTRTVYMRYRGLPEGDWSASQTETDASTMDALLPGLIPDMEYEVQASLYETFPATDTQVQRFNTLSATATPTPTPVPTATPNAYPCPQQHPLIRLPPNPHQHPTPTYLPTATPTPTIPHSPTQGRAYHDPHPSTLPDTHASTVSHPYSHGNSQPYPTPTNTPKPAETPAPTSTAISNCGSTPITHPCPYLDISGGGRRDRDRFGPRDHHSYIGHCFCYGARLLRIPSENGAITGLGCVSLTRCVIYIHIIVLKIGDRSGQGTTDNPG